MFGNLQGNPDTMGGVKASLDWLMDECFAQARKNGTTFRCFSHQDCLPLEVTDRLERGDTDSKIATGHTSDKKIAMTYDRRPAHQATGAA